ncbi:DUF6233 domain-containing protein [Streptomyces sp. NPDC005571]|uniref:DUF6233 domain-containing protein n=1 Tax=Streptomyces sp. NPDC005571 TaxID=3156888 RepID=UPI0033A1732B
MVIWAQLAQINQAAPTRARTPTTHTAASPRPWSGRQTVPGASGTLPVQPRRSSSSALLHRGNCTLHKNDFRFISCEKAVIDLAEPDIDACQICNPQTGWGTSWVCPPARVGRRPRTGMPRLVGGGQPGQSIGARRAVASRRGAPWGFSRTIFPMGYR